MNINFVWSTFQNFREVCSTPRDKFDLICCQIARNVESIWNAFIKIIVGAIKNYTCDDVLEIVIKYSAKMIDDHAEIMCSNTCGFLGQMDRGGNQKSSTPVSRLARIRALSNFDILFFQWRRRKGYVMFDANSGSFHEIPTGARECDP